MGKIAFLFAGQGAQYTGMGKTLYETSPAAKRAFDIAEGIRPGTMAQCFRAEKEELSITINTQPCLFVVDYACAVALEEQGVQAAMAAGFSLGEVAAVAFCGMLSFEEAFQLVCERARLMQACAEKHPGAMGAVLKLDAGQVEALCGQFAGIYPVNYNAPGQTVVSGKAEALPAFEQTVKEAGGRFMKLAVSGSFHSPFTHEAAEGLRQYMQKLRFAAPRIPLYANATAAPYGEAVADTLAKQVESPVLFQKSVERMAADGCAAAIEVGAGTTLTGLVKKIGGIAHTANVENTQTLHATVAYCKEASLC